MAGELQAYQNRRKPCLCKHSYREHRNGSKSAAWYDMACQVGVCRCETFRSRPSWDWWPRPRWKRISLEAIGQRKRRKRERFISWAEL